MKHRLHIFSFVLAVVLLLPLPVRAITSSYYSSIDGKKEANLRNALYTITSVGPANGHNYNNLWTAYKTTDVYPSDSAGKAGKIWDMYSDCLFTPGASSAGGDQCGNYSGVCDCYNREHSLPKSWFNDKTPAYYDMGHIVPTDGKTNGMRSNYVFGECASGYATWGTGKLGNAKAVTTNNVKGSSTITTSFTGTAFEPADKYKGDFARMYMYMIVRYKYGNSDNITFTASGTEGSTMFNSTDTNYGLTDYSVALLMKWHRQDPVSQKEINRNNGMETVQGNRNPFIDYPCLAEYLWGSKAGQAVTLSELVGTFTGSWTSGDGCPCEGPTITSPTGTVNIGTTNTSNSIYKDVTVQGTNLESGSLTLTIGGTNGSYFKLPGGLSSATISKAQAEAGYNITITYSPTSNSNPTHTATLTISGCGVTSHVVTLTGTCTTVYTATWMADGSQVGTSYAASGTSPDVPASTPTCTADRVFMGWTDNENYSGSGSGLFTDEAPTMTTDKTFYAVYADKETSGGGASGSVTITTSTTNIPTSYGSANTFTEYTLEGYKFQIQQMYLNSGKLQWRAAGNASGTGTMYNSGTFPGKISSIVLTYNSSDGNKNFTLYVGSSANPTSGTSITPTSSGLVYTFNCSSQNADYFVLTNGSGAGYLDQIVINYSGSTTTYSNYSTQCTACTPVAATASYAHSSRTTTCGGTVNNTFTTNSNATRTYTSSNEAVATVASDGTVTPVGAGTATITATVPANTCYTGGASASFTLTVNRTNTSASFVSPTTTVGVGSSVTNTVSSESDGTVTYSSSNTSVATVNSSGQVTGKVAGTAIITANVAQSSCYNATSATYTITVETAPEYTVTFMNMGGTHATRTGTAGSAISAASEPTACTGYTFEGWSTSQYAVDNTGTPSLSTPTTIPAGNVTYYAVYSKTEGSGSSAATAGTTLWSEDFSGYSADDVPSGTITSSHTGTTIYGNSTITYACDNGGGTTKIYDANLAGGTSPEILIAKSNGSFSISGIPTGSAETMTLLFNTNKSGYPSNFSITSGTSGISIGSLSSPAANQLSCSITNANGVTTFDLTITYTYSQNGREDNFLLTVATAGSGGSTTYHTTAPDCCTATITATSNDSSMGTVGVTVP